MNINRHNYEEFFILYWDNELTAVQKQAVENFVKENPDLQEEFQLLAESRFTADNQVEFKEKEFLLNNSFINIINYQEQLLNYIDDELNSGEKSNVEKFVLQFPDAQKELALLQKAKIQPETEIIFPDKSSLYRRKEKVRVINMAWFRVAVAAAIILIAGFTVFNLINNNKGDQPLVSEGNSKNEQVSDDNGSAKSNSEDQTKNNLQTDVNKKNDVVKVEINKKEKSKQPLNELNIPQIVQRENKNNLPKERKNKQADHQQPEIDEALADNNDLLQLKPDNNIAEKNRSGIVNASFGNSDVTLNAKPSLYMPEPEEKEKDGGGLKEFLRKTTRVFERRTKIQTTTEDNKLLVGVFAVSLK